MYSSSFQQIQHFPNWFAVNDLQDCRDMVMWRADMYLSVLSSLPFYINVMNTKLNFHMHVGFACVCTYILTFACEHLNFFFFANKQQVSLWVTENIPLFSSIFSHGYQLLAWLPTGLWSQFIEEHWLDLGTSKTREDPWMLLLLDRFVVLVSTYWHGGCWVNLKMRRPQFTSQCCFCSGKVMEPLVQGLKLSHL